MWEESLTEYRVNKRKIKEFSKRQRMNKEKQSIVKNEEIKYSDFTDLDIKKFIDEKCCLDQSTAQHHNIPKFRFESYNNNDYKNASDLRKWKRSRSEPRYMFETNRIDDFI